MFATKQDEESEKTAGNDDDTNDNNNTDQHQQPTTGLRYWMPHQSWEAENLSQSRTIFIKADVVLKLSDILSSFLDVIVT